MNISERRAAALISLALARNGYITSKEVRLNGYNLVDVLAEKTLMEHPWENDVDRFAVEVKAIDSTKDIPVDLSITRKEVEQRLNMPVYFSYFLDSADILFVDNDLRERMRYPDDDVTIKSIEQKKHLDSNDNP